MTSAIQTRNEQDARQSAMVKPGDVPAWCAAIREISLEQLDAIKLRKLMEGTNEVIANLLSSDKARVQASGVRLQIQWANTWSRLMDSVTRFHEATSGKRSGAAQPSGAAGGGISVSEATIVVQNTLTPPPSDPHQTPVDAQVTDVQ
jgi:hypothetical protein